MSTGAHGDAGNNGDERSREGRRLGAGAFISRFDFTRARRNVSAELAGVVSKIGFENGATAKKDDLLVQLDASAEEAQLHSAEADLELARADLERARDLAARKVVSKAEPDAAEIQIQTEDRIGRSNALDDREEDDARAFDGRWHPAGQHRPDGHCRSASCALQSLDPVFADFALPQQVFAQLSAGLEVRVTTDAVPGRVLLETDRDELDGRHRNAQCFACKQLSRIRTTCCDPECSPKSKSCCRRNNDARHSRHGGFLCAVWRFSLCDREKERSKRPARNHRRSGSNSCASAKRAAILFASRRD